VRTFVDHMLLKLWPWLNAFTKLRSLFCCALCNYILLLSQVREVD
jgi:hypothetical protein